MTATVLLCVVAYLWMVPGMFGLLRALGVSKEDSGWGDAFLWPLFIWFVLVVALVGLLVAPFYWMRGGEAKLREYWK